MGRSRRTRSTAATNDLTYVVQVPCDLPVTLVGDKIRADAVAGALTDLGLLRWQQYSSGEGSKGLKYHDWAWIGAIGIDDGPADGFEYSLLIRRSVSDPTDITYLLAHVPFRTPLPKLIRIGGDRWAIEEDNPPHRQERDRPGPLRGPQVDALASPCHVLHVRRRVSCDHTRR